MVVVAVGVVVVVVVVVSIVALVYRLPSRHGRLLADQPTNRLADKFPAAGKQGFGRGNVGHRGAGHHRRLGQPHPDWPRSKPQPGVCFDFFFGGGGLFASGW